MVALVGSYFDLNSKLNRSVTLPAYTGASAGQNWLIAGADSRQGLSARQIVRLHVGRDFGTENSDSLMLLHLGGGRPVLLSIPRDSYVPIPGFGDNKINAALGFGGPRCSSGPWRTSPGCASTTTWELGSAGWSTW